MFQGSYLFPNPSFLGIQLFVFGGEKTLVIKLIYPSSGVDQKTFGNLFYQACFQSFWIFNKIDKSILGGGFKYFLFSQLPREMIQFD